MLPASRDLSKAYEHVDIEVREKERVRLDLYLLRMLGWNSRTKIQKLIEHGRVELNGQTTKPSARVSRGDHLRIFLDPGGELGHRVEIPKPFWEDAYLLAINKPPHVLVHPVGRTVSGTVVTELHHHYQPINRPGARRVIPKLCHRLDRDTSGLLLIAKVDLARRALSEDFEQNRIEKSYLAVVEGHPPPEFEATFAIRADLDRQRSHNNRLAKADPTGKWAKTRFERLRSVGRLTLVRCFPTTGRQNQIRIHLAESGYPIYGDSGYGSRPLPGHDFPDRALLHSASLRFRHPLWRTRCILEAEAPEDFARYLDGSS